MTFLPDDLFWLGGELDAVVMERDRVNARVAQRAMQWDQLERLVSRLAPQLAVQVAALRAYRLPEIELPTWGGDR